MDLSSCPKKKRVIVSRATSIGHIPGFTYDCSCNEAKACIHMAAVKTLFPENSPEPAWMAIKPNEIGSSVSKVPDDLIVFDTIEAEAEQDGTGRCVVISPDFSREASIKASISDLKVVVHSIYHGVFSVVSGKDWWMLDVIYWLYSWN
jgi:hypothetical protein